MSYIRAGSNPEGLYIFGNGNHQVEILGGLPISKLPGPHMAVIVPRSSFHHVAKRWREDDCVPARHKGLSVDEVQVFLKTGKRVPKKMPLKKWIKEPIAFLICLSWKKWKIFMWRVTWEYIVDGIIRRDSGAC